MPAAERGVPRSKRPRNRGACEPHARRAAGHELGKHRRDDLLDGELVQRHGDRVNFAPMAFSSSRRPRATPDHDRPGGVDTPMRDAPASALDSALSRSLQGAGGTAAASMAAGAGLAACVSPNGVPNATTCSNETGTPLRPSGREFTVAMGVADCVPMRAGCFCPRDHSCHRVPRCWVRSCLQAAPLSATVLPQ